MALIVYPSTGWDAFVSLADCNTILTNTVPSSQLVAWTALSDIDKEVYIRQSTMLINAQITPPDTLEQDLKTATSYLSNFSIDTDMTNEDGSDNVKVKEIVGVVKTEYFTKSEDKSNEFPDIVVSLISQYYTKASSSFSFVRA